MWLVGLITFLTNGFLAIFSLSLSYKEKKQIYYIHSIIFVTLAMLSIYYYMYEYLIEAFITFFIIGGFPMIFDKHIPVPALLRDKSQILTYLLIASTIISSLIFIFI